jgi:Mn-dependent DtxR family transcriptional regulator
MKETISKSNEIQLKLELSPELKEELQEIKDLIRNTREFPDKRFLRSKELSRILGVSESSLQNMRLAGLLPYKKFQGIILYDLQEVYAAIEEHSFNKKDKK